MPQLARLLEVEPQAVRYWINGRNDPNLPSVLKLAAIFFGGSVEQLAERAGFSQVRILQEIAAQMEGLRAGPTSPQPNGELFTAPLHLPVGVFNTNDRDTFGLASNAVKAINDLLRRTGAHRALQAQAHAVVAQSLGRRNALVAQMWYDLAYAELMLGHYPQGLEAAEAVRDASRGWQNTALLADSHWLSGECLRIMGNLADARRHCEQADKLYRQAGAPFHMEALARRGRHRDGVMLMLWGTAYLHELQGDFDAALALL